MFTITQLTEREMQLVDLISKECATPGDITAKLKTLFLNVNEKVYHVILNLFTTNDHQKVYQH
jgi:hypothetical protein